MALYAHITDGTIDQIGALPASLYAKDAKVSHNGRRWTADVGNNHWEPGVYGWTDAGPA